MNFFATLRDTQGHELSNRAVTWSVSDSSVIKIPYTSGQTVVIRAVTAGSSLLTATSEGKSGAAQVVVTARVPVASVTVTPPADTLGAGDAATFLASPRDAQGNALTNRAVTWVVGDSSVARVEQVLGQSAQVRALKQGTTIITATSEGHSGSAQVVVTAPPPVASVSVTPPVDTLVAGNDSASFNATLRDAAGNPLNGRVVTWTVSDSSVIAIQYANGQWAVIRALKPGSATLTATSEGTSGSASVIVQ